MCRLLPAASRIGFTGTPLFKYDNITERTFGSYVSVYDFKRAVEDVYKRQLIMRRCWEMTAPWDGAPTKKSC